MPDIPFYFKRRDGGGVLERWFDHFSAVRLDHDDTALVAQGYGLDKFSCGAVEGELLPGDHRSVAFEKSGTTNDNIPGLFDCQSALTCFGNCNLSLIPAGLVVQVNSGNKCLIEHSRWSVKAIGRKCICPFADQIKNPVRIFVGVLLGLVFNGRNQAGYDIFAE